MSFGGEVPHAQCMGCGKMLRGPLKDQVYERRDEAGSIIPIYGADKGGPYYLEEAEGRPHNMSGSMCPDCYRKSMEKLHRDKELARKQEIGRESASTRAREVRTFRRMEQDRIDAQMAARRKRRQEARDEQEREEEAAARRARARYARRGLPPSG